MENTRPIAIIYFPYEFSFSESGHKIKPLDLMQNFNGMDRNNPHEPLGGYLWFCFHKEGITEPEFKVFHTKDFTKIEYNELKELVLNQFNNVNSTIQ